MALIWGQFHGECSWYSSLIYIFMIATASPRGQWTKVSRHKIHSADSNIYILCVIHRPDHFEFLCIMGPHTWLLSRDFLTIITCWCLNMLIGKISSPTKKKYSENHSTNVCPARRACKTPPQGTTPLGLICCLTRCIYHHETLCTTVRWMSDRTELAKSHDRFGSDRDWTHGPNTAIAIALSPFGQPSYRLCQRTICKIHVRMLYSHFSS